VTTGFTPLILRLRYTLFSYTKIWNRPQIMVHKKLREGREHCPMVLLIDWYWQISTHWYYL